MRSTSKVLVYVLAWRNSGTQRPPCARPHRRAARSGLGEQGSSQVADVHSVFDFWLIKGQLLATVPTSRAFANI